MKNKRLKHGSKSNATRDAQWKNKNNAKWKQNEHEARKTMNKQKNERWEQTKQGKQ